ncbi:MAG: peptidoglycan-binding protein LysM [Paracoccus denitrificans]|nr:MAG: peptidoglycan-binding protein LysM [Paracoccus denitrificans]PZO83737.1 MAG: peptidoglycan-binding protein LysM [Paracoccus denitrificans]
MGLWDFVKDAGASVFGEAKAEEQPKEQPKAAPTAAPNTQAAPKPAHDAETQRKLDALNAEVKRVGLDSSKVHLYLTGDTVRVENKGADRETMEKLILAVGNIKGIAKVEAELPPAAPGTPTDPVFHAVKKGENLSAIAKEYLGDANRYREIFEANKPMLSDPDKIYPGQSLRIPAK